MSAQTQTRLQLQQIEQAGTADEVQALVRESERVLAVGAGTKPGMYAAGHKARGIDLSRLTGIVEYEPAEYTITALAGTPVSELKAALSDNGQALPFDPMLVRAGSSVGGAVASGLSGPGRLRYGGIRDFILGTRFVDGQGRLLRGGGKVVKNAAGFDFPKLMVGSFGSLGVLIDVTFKVFPQPSAFATLLSPYTQVETALQDMQQFANSPIELLALDLLCEPQDGSYVLAARIGGTAELLNARIERLQSVLPASTVLQTEDDAAFWNDASELSWADGEPALVKVPLTPSEIPTIEAAFASHMSPRRYSVAGNVLWLPWSDAVHELSDLLRSHNLTGVILRGHVSHPLLGLSTGSTFADRVKRALDPHSKFPPTHTF